MKKNEWSVRECQRVSESVRKCQRVSESVRECPRVSESVRECPRVSESVRECQRVSESVRECQRVSESVRECQKVSESVSSTLDDGWSSVTTLCELLWARPANFRCPSSGLSLCRQMYALTIRSEAAVVLSHYHHHHYHLSLNRGRWGITDEFATSFLHLSLFSAALWDLANSRPVHSLMLSSHLFLCPPCLLPPFTVPCKMVLAGPDERET